MDGELDHDERESGDLGELAEDDNGGASPRYSDFSAYSSNGEDMDTEAPVPEVRASQHFFNADGIGYAEHYYVVEVKINELCYSVDRNVLDFVELDRKLRKRFGSVELDPLPFNEDAVATLRSELEKNEKLLSAAKKAGANENDRDSTFSPSRAESLESSRSGGFFSPSKAPRQLHIATTDRMDRKLSSLSSYLQALLLHHEIIVAEEFSMFFDEEAPSMLVHPSSLEPLTIHDILLLDEPVYKCIVRKREEVNVSVEPGQLVVWRFATLDYDIAMGVDLNGVSKISFTRYNAHLKPVCGTLLVNPHEEGGEGGKGVEKEETVAAAAKHSGREGGCVCTLKFDNSYAKLHTKKLQWAARVVNFEEYTEAKERALAVMAEKHNFEVQRHSFHRYMIILAMTKGNVIHSSSVREDFLREEAQARKAQAREINKLRTLLSEAEETAAQAVKIQEETQASAAAVSDSWKFTLQELDLAKEELEKVSLERGEWNRAKELAEMVTREAASQANREEMMRSELEIAVKGRKEKEAENEQLTSAMELALGQADATVTALEKKLKTANATIEQLRNARVQGDTAVVGAGANSNGSSSGSGNSNDSELSGRISEAIERISVSRRQSESGLKR